jgi:VWFA-related protein
MGASRIRRLALAGVLTPLALTVCLPSSVAQRGSNPISGTTPGAVPLINVGGGPMEAQFESLDFAQKILEQQNRKPNPKEVARRQGLVDSGMVSALDLAAPEKAISEFNKGTELMRGRQSEEAISHLQKAVTLDPKFVSAHDYLGLAYLDADQPDKAKAEFQTAVNLDPKFPGSFINLGRLELAQNDPANAQSNLEKAAALRPSDAAVLTTLAFAQLSNRQYSDAIQSVERVHAMPHPGAGNAHYVAAIAAVALDDVSLAKREFAQFLEEDPNNPLAATARYNIDVLNKNQQAGAIQRITQVTVSGQNPANSEKLRTQLAAAVQDPSESQCGECNSTTTLAAATPAGVSLPVTERTSGTTDQWTIRKVVDEVAVFFGVTSGGHMVSDLSLTEITVRDDSKPPEKVLQFTPQSKLPLRIGLLIDTSGSVQPRFSFEKHAAAKFLEQMLSNTSDLGFIAGFSDNVRVVQDFTGNHDELTKAIDQLSNGGGTALFDSVSRACWILADYPEQERVAKVLVVLSDGEENASHNTLRQTVRDIESTGVTIYTISTRPAGADQTEADKVLQLIAERSGGEAFFPGDIQALTHSFDKLRDEIRSRYLIAYRPADFEPNGKYRTIVITAQKNGKPMKVHARQGYHARADSPTQ